jgi:diguanylate cyclase (GGDEF)-like protein
MISSAFAAALGVALGWLLSSRRFPTTAATPSGTRPSTPDPEARAVAPLSDPAIPLQAERFSSLLRDVLEDIRLQHGARSVVIWREVDGAGHVDRLCGDAAVVDEIGDAMPRLVQWAMAEHIVVFGPDGELPSCVVAPIAMDAEHAEAALVVVFEAPFVGARPPLKQWMLRHGRRIRLLDELLVARHELARTNRRVRHILREVAQWDAAATDDSLAAQYCALVASLLAADGAALVRWDEEAMRGTVVAAYGDCAGLLDHAVDSDSLVADSCRENVPGIWHDIGAPAASRLTVVARDAANLGGAVLIHPLRRRADVIGAVVAVSRTAGALQPADMRTLSLVDAAGTSRLVASWRLAEVTQRAVIDGLTGLTNRRGFEVAMATAREEAERYGWETSVLLVDLDHFKLVNDSFGHEAGDDVLRAVARVLRERVREIDLCARVGGEEVAVILKNTGSDGAIELAQRLRAAIAALRVDVAGRRIGVTASIGVATHPTEVLEWDAVYRSADSALYAAKHAGRDQVCVFGAPTSQRPPLA